MADTDNERAGMLPFAFEDGMGFERYVDYALDVPMYFVKREDSTSTRPGLRSAICSRASCPARRPARHACRTGRTILDDFPRGAAEALSRDARRRCRAVGRLTALPAFWVGILYDDASLDAAWDLVKDWSAEERQTLRDEVPRHALNAQIRGRAVRDLAKECLALSEAGLKRRGFLDSDRRDEARYLEPLQEIVARGTTPAEELLAKYAGTWAVGRPGV